MKHKIAPQVRRLLLRRLQQLRLHLPLDHIIKVILSRPPFPYRLPRSPYRIPRCLHDAPRPFRTLTHLIMRPIVILHNFADIGLRYGLDGGDDGWQPLQTAFFEQDWSIRVL